MNAPQTEPELFDQHVDRYEEELAAAISASGEGREYFAEGRVKWLKQCLDQADYSPRSVLDFGCGDGSTAPLLLGILKADVALGVDVSERSVAIAKQRYASEQINYEILAAFRPAGTMDLVYCNGVFHHIPPAKRAAAFAMVNDAVGPGGFFALWENNPWNPVMRYAMARCAFDRDAILMRPGETRSLLRAAGFEILRTDFRFVFPRALRALRPLEDVLCRMPLGAQYQILSRKMR